MLLNSGLAFMALVLGSFHGFVPLARATKFRTVMGVSFSKSLAVMAPIEVLKIAYRPGSRAGAAGVPGVPAGALAGAAGGACAKAAPAINKRIDSRFI